MKQQCRGSTFALGLEVSLESPTDNDPLAREVARAAAEIASGPDDIGPTVRLERLHHPNPPRAFVARIHELGASLLIIGEADDHRDDWHANAQRLLFERAPCDTLLIKPGKDSNRVDGSVLVSTAGGPNAFYALQLAVDLTCTSAIQPKGSSWTWTRSVSNA